MKVSTGRFKEAVNKAIKGASFNNLLPLTSMLGIKLKDGKINLLTTDMTNTLCVVVDKVAGDEVSFTIQADTFAKLISKVTSDEVELNLVDDVLVVKANGTYKIPLVTDENGVVEFPDIPVFDNIPASEVKLSSIMNVYNINRSSLAKTMEQPELTGYYVGDMVISTDATVICFNGIDMNMGEVLVPASLLNLLTLNTQENIKFMKNGKNLMFVTDNVIVYGSILEGIEDYPVEAIKGYLDEAFPSSCKVPKDLLISVLDRLSLFIEPYDKNGAYFTFGRKGITIHSKKDASTEVINYTGSEGFAPFNCCVDIPMFKEQLQANPDDVVELFYGSENALKLVSGNITQVVALLEDSEA